MALKKESVPFRDCPLIRIHRCGSEVTGYVLGDEVKEKRGGGSRGTLET